MKVEISARLPVQDRSKRVMGPRMYAVPRPGEVNAPFGAHGITGGDPDVGAIRTAVHRVIHDDERRARPGLERSTARRGCDGELAGGRARVRSAEADARDVKR